MEREKEEVAVPCGFPEHFAPLLFCEITISVILKPYKINLQNHVANTNLHCKEVILCYK